MSSRLPDPTRAYWPADTSEPIVDLSSGAALRRSASRHPDRTALVEVVPAGMPSLSGASDTARRWTYAQLLAEAEQCARWLGTRFQPGERICVWAPNLPEWMILQYGVALAGMVLVTANPALRPPELAYVLRQSRSRAIFHTAAFRGTDMSATVREVAGDCWTFCFADWDRVVRAHQGDGALPDVDPGSPAQIQYTSGTTGDPKGALLHHRGLVTNASLVARRAHIDQSVLISPMPLFHTGGSVLSSLGAVVTASTLVLPLLFDPELMLRTIERERCDFASGVPTMLFAMLEVQQHKHYDLGSLRTTQTGGAPVPPELLRRIETAFGCDLLAVYGETEASPVITQTAAEDSFEDKSETAGRPLPQVEVRIADPVSNEVLAVGAQGEIQARGYQVMIEYFDKPQATADTVTPDGWLRTGDLGTMDARGYVKVTGRLKDMIIRGGENIYPAEIEARLIEHPKIVQAAVFGAPDPRWGEIVCAVVQWREGQAPTVGELREHLARSLSPQKTPARWLACADLPLTGSGKIQKFRLREMLAEGALTPLAD
ncbi:MAG: AMP-binding protein [Burkholderiaceae bacterium]